MSFLKPGDVVRFIERYHDQFTHGVITEHVPAHGGYLVKVPTHPEPGGFGYEEVIYDHTPELVKGLSAWERLLGPSLV